MKIAGATKPKPFSKKSIRLNSLCWYIIKKHFVCFHSIHCRSIHNPRILFQPVNTHLSCRLSFITIKLLIQELLKVGRGWGKRQKWWKFCEIFNWYFWFQNKSDQIHSKRLAPDHSLDKQPNSWLKKTDINGHLDFKVIWQKYIQLHSGIVAPQLGLSTLEDATQKHHIYLFCNIESSQSKQGGVIVTHWYWKSLNRLLKVCYVPATSAVLIAFFSSYFCCSH